MNTASSLNTGTVGTAHLELTTGQYIPNLTNRSSLCSIFSLTLYGTGLAQKYLGIIWGYRDIYLKAFLVFPICQKKQLCTQDIILFSFTLSDVELTSEAAKELNISFQLNCTFPKMSLPSTFGEHLSVIKNVVLIFLFNLFFYFIF